MGSDPVCNSTSGRGSSKGGPLNELYNVISLNPIKHPGGIQVNPHHLPCLRVANPGSATPVATNFSIRPSLPEEVRRVLTLTPAFFRNGNGMLNTHRFFNGQFGVDFGLISFI
jgi:hypothetical protein